MANLNARISKIMARLKDVAEAKGMSAVGWPLHDPRTGYMYAIVIQDGPAFEGRPVKVVWISYDSGDVEIRSPGEGADKTIAKCSFDEFEKAFFEGFGG